MRANPMKRLVAALTFFLVLLAVLAATAPASNVLFPAIYKGTPATGGTMEFEVSADGTQIIRFALTKVPVPPCATITGETPRKVAIVNDTFSNSLGLLHFSGTFPALGQAQGTLSFHRKEGLCDSEEVSWTASAPLPSPVEPPAPPPPPPAPVPPPDESAPQTQITSGPSGVVHRRRAVFRFSATEVGATFRCRLDDKAWGACESGWTYRGLKQGRHVFRVKATDEAENVDSTPAIRRWRVKLS
jgi:hypothetical protein